ncbi:RluA family pseudouridine synthase [Draconibacterium halophilum]|uniref:RNA pseudouridine synthase n=1 Tax=Draconibacterium halophilum TaxID=2706887 RepID=A0A6C0RH03_9BACT|nr:RNA pseudouridine synthase [Draconibacterium halophilum]QIA09276.1 RNA pseudouridine synthase [Draconibacterium halophilum]
MNVVYEDNHIIAINKACGDVVQGDKTGDETVIDKVKHFLKVKYKKPGNVYLGLPHRLDRPTSGLLILAKTSKVLPRLNKLFQTKDGMRKVYWAVVDKRPPKYTDTIEHYLRKDQEKNRSYAFNESKPGAKFASLTYRHVASIDRYHLLEVEIHTGRHHQIRVQLRQLHLHIKGDLKYGAARSNKDKGIHLHARKVEFIHPVRKTPLTIVADPPKDPVWDEFMNIFNAGKFSPVEV